MKLNDLTQDVFNEHFRVFIKNIRLERGISQTEFADMLGVDQSFISYMENDKRDFDFWSAVRVCKVLGVSMSDFIETIDTTKTPV